MSVEKFTIAIADDVIADLRDRLHRTRLATDFGNADWRYGVNGDYLRSLIDYWANDFDWTAQQRAINRFDHYRTNIDGVPIHFMRKNGTGPTPIPIVLTHGWPWTFWDYGSVIDALADPLAHGGIAADSFDVVVPSLPGFGFSSPLAQTGISCWRTADLWQRLMTEELGYTRYAAQGGDWGAIVTSQLAHKYAASLIGIHVTLPVWPGVFSGPRPYDLLGGVLPSLPEDLADRAIAAERRLASHIATHLLDPQTLAYGMNDSPAGLLAWLLERWRAWSDCGGDVETRFSRDHMLTSATIYWATQTLGTSARFYAETARDRWRPSHERTPVFEAPAGISLFRGDGAAVSNDANLANYRVHHLADHPSGGHFAPVEEPAVLIDDIRATFRNLR